MCGIHTPFLRNAHTGENGTVTPIERNLQYVKHQEEKGWRGIVDRILTLANDICCKLEIKRYKCPVCGKKTLSSRGSFEICSECGWEDEGIDDDDEEPVFGPNGDYTIREYREEYFKLKKKDPKYRWCKSFSEDD